MMLTRVICGIALFVAAIAITLQWIEHDKRMKLQRTVDRQQTVLKLVGDTLASQKTLNSAMTKAVIELLKGRANTLRLTVANG